jgi:hypothetical protein
MAPLKSKSQMLQSVLPVAPAISSRWDMYIASKRTSSPAGSATLPAAAASPPLCPQHSVTVALILRCCHTLFASIIGSSSNVEDLNHFLLECPAYDDLRAVCPAFPADVCNTLSSPGCVAAVMGHSAQAALANTLFHMKVRCSELLELPWV